MKKKKVFIVVCLSVVILMGGIFLKSSFTSSKQGQFQYVEIKRGDLEDTVSSTGTLSAVRTINVGSQVSGNIEKIYVDYNSPVKKGQLIAVLDKTLFNVSIRDAKAAVLRAEARLDQANAEVNRNRPLCEKGHLSEMEFLVTKTNAATAAADLKSAEAALSRSQTQLKYTEIRSPINGTVIERTIDEGQTIAANFQAPTLFIIAEDLTQMQIEVLVDESDIGLIRENQPARFTVQAYPEDVFVGTVRQIRLQPRTEQNVVNYTVVVDSSNTEGLLMPGMTATVDFVVESRKNVLLVPNSALSFKPGKDVVKKYRKQLKANMKKNPNSSVRNMARSKLPDNMAMVFYMETDGTLAVTVVTKGASNLKYTEIASDPILRAGVSVVNGFKKEKETDSRDAAFTLPRPGGPGGPG